MFKTQMSVYLLNADVCLSTYLTLPEQLLMTKRSEGNGVK